MPLPWALFRQTLAVARRCRRLGMLPPSTSISASNEFRVVRVSACSDDRTSGCIPSASLSFASLARVDSFTNRDLGLPYPSPDYATSSKLGRCSWWCLGNVLSLKREQIIFPDA